MLLENIANGEAASAAVTRCDQLAVCTLMHGMISIQARCQYRIVDELLQLSAYPTEQDKISMLCEKWFLAANECAMDLMPQAVSFLLMKSLSNEAKSSGWLPSEIVLIYSIF